jgi:hypothetical protein
MIEETRNTSPVVINKPNLPRKPIIRVVNQAGSAAAACSGSVMRVQFKGSFP